MEPVTLIGVLLIVLGIASFFVPQLTRVINFPGSRKVKAVATVAVGVLLIVIGTVLR